jgi:3-oxoacyl-[acyl-carrier protein] reductase
MFDLEGHTALVTGGAGALGSAVCKALASRGARVAVADTRGEAAARVAQGLGSGESIGVEVDVTDELSVLEAIDRTSESLGSVDIVVTTAGYGERVSFAEMKFAEWRSMFAVHVDGSFLAIRHTLPAMLRQGWGRVIGFSSIASGMGVARQSHYAASKGAIDGMVRSLAREVASQGVTVNAIAPGYFESPLNDGASPERLGSLRASVPAGRFGDPDEIGALALYLASPEAAYLTGQVISPNGGMVFCVHTGD